MCIHGALVEVKLDRILTGLIFLCKGLEMDKPLGSVQGIL